MPQYFAFLRAINVGGHTVKMEELRQHFFDLGFQKVETFIASGNVVFYSDSRDLPTLETRIEDALKQKLGFETAVFIRTPQELLEAVGRQPFPADRYAVAEAFNVAFLKQPIDADSMSRLKALENGIDRFVAEGREFYWLCQVKQSQSKFANVSLEKITGQPSTMRQVSTMRKLTEKYCR